MTFISYAQNYEDVMLWRALKHIKHGFYIDVGAAWPDNHSVTKAFFDAGWSGINIEPNPDLLQHYFTQRPHDINLNLAISDTPGSQTMGFIDQTGLSSLEQHIIDAHSAEGYVVRETTVEVTTLQAVCQQYATHRDIHFLKVDVEGYERQALLSNDWSTIRPWIVLVEATYPMQQRESHHEWESILLEANYCFAYADGLNRFYVSNEHVELLEAFKYPPNVFDRFQLSEQVELLKIKQEVAELRTHLMAVKHSLSWRITHPLRALKKGITFGASTIKHIIGRIKRKIQSMARSLILIKLAKYPRLHMRILKLLSHYYPAKRQLAIAQELRLISPRHMTTLDDLPLEAQCIYTQLTNEIIHLKQGLHR